MSNYNYDITVIRTLKKELLSESEIQTHAAVVAALESLPPPWTPSGPFKSLKPARSGDVTTMDFIRGKTLPPWIPEIMVNYRFRSPGVIDLFQNANERIVVQINSTAVPQAAWCGAIAETFIHSWSPSVIYIENIAASLRRGKASGEYRKKHGSAMPSFSPLFSKWYGGAHVTETWYASQETCQRCFGISSEVIADGLIRLGVNAEALPQGVYIRGAERYLDADAAWDLQQRHTDALKQVLLHCGAK